MASLYPPFLIVHIVALVLLAGVCFAALAAPQPDRRRFSLIWSGVLALIVFVTGFGLLGVRRMSPYEGWVIVKLVCWLALAMAAPMAFRRPARVTMLSAVTIGAIVIGVVMVILRPF